MRYLIILLFLFSFNAFADKIEKIDSNTVKVTKETIIIEKISDLEARVAMFKEHNKFALELQTFYFAANEKYQPFIQMIPIEDISELEAKIAQYKALK